MGSNLIRPCYYCAARESTTTPGYFPSCDECRAQRLREAKERARARAIEARAVAAEKRQASPRPLPTCPDCGRPVTEPRKKIHAACLEDRHRARSRERMRRLRADPAFRESEKAPSRERVRRWRERRRLDQEQVAE